MFQLYRADVYLTVPRWRSGVPSTLNRLVTRDGKHVLQAYPSWEMQEVGDCSALQYVQSMEIDPNTGYMWIIDNGRTNTMESTPQNLCPPKLIIWDIEKNREVHRFIFPPDVASHTSCFLNDIVLDYVDGRVAFAYITDTNDAKLYVYDHDRNDAYFFQHPSMRPESPDGTPIDGIAMSPTFDYLFYCPISSHGLFQIPTTVLRDRHADYGQHVRRVDTRLSRSDGLTYGQRNLYYGLLDLNGVARWNISGEGQDPRCLEGVVKTSQQKITSEAVKMRWVDTFGWDEKGYLWFTANDLSRFMNTAEDGPVMYVWKIFVNESSYLTHARQKPNTNYCSALVG
ncbi:hypothetical protein C0Q70_07914 [Pomacea canaliculata]|uniref:Bee-milk protein n=1 Tax=Pomacea canaliculata TaxID=400727 RepID=A0A2T7PGB2_POMCA|nr:hypothetical protein C0Q70_07914 [Pomacea canaliculata]